MSDIADIKADVDAHLWLNLNQVQILYLYDVYLLARWLLFTGLKYLDYISSIKIRHNDIINL
jgi:hypothetical protein